MTREERRVLLKGGNEDVYGIDTIDVAPGPGGGWRLTVHLLTGEPSAVKAARGLFSLSPSQVRITGPGGGRADVSVKRVEPGRAARAQLIVHLAAVGGADSAVSPGLYSLQLVCSSLDPLLNTAPFSLKSGAQADIDPATLASGDAEPGPAAPIDYLAKDFASFRRVMIDQIAREIPDWRERNPSDLGIALIETLAYAADDLSYYQDAVATEAYLGTARRRTSLRRHGRLVDYRVSDGCNSRVWVQVCVDADAVELPAGTPLIACDFDLPMRIDPVIYRRRIIGDLKGAYVFETMYEKTLDQRLNTAGFYCWGKEGYELEAGATSAWLAAHYPTLSKGDVLIFEPRTAGNGGRGLKEPGRLAHPVRLIEAPRLTCDPVTGADVTEIRWRFEDALPFAIPVSSAAPDANGAGPGYVAAGNIVLADSGRTEPAEVLPPVPERGRFRPRLRWHHVTYAEPFDLSAAETLSAAEMLQQNRDKILPVVALQRMVLSSDGADEGLTAQGPRWRLCRDLLSSGRFSRDFVVETDVDGSAVLRFGDGDYGRRPDPGTRLAVRYRTGSGQGENVSAGAIAHLVSGDGRITGVRNPLPATDGVDAETSFHIRALAPLQLRRQERCITEADFADAARAFGGVKDAVAEARWTGSWRTMYVWVQRVGGLGLDDAFRDDLREFLNRRRPAGLDIEIRGPDYVPLDLLFEVGVVAGTPARLVERRLIETFSDKILADGRVGYFYPDRLRFGATLYLSDLVTAIAAVEGVLWVVRKRFRRFDAPTADDNAAGVLAFAPHEIARVDNDTAAPQRGRIAFDLLEGR